MEAPTSSHSVFPDQEILDFVESQEKLKVVVEAPSRYHPPFNHLDLNNAYFLPSTGSKGLALILNIVEFDAGKHRNGSLIDVHYLSELFTQLDYELYPKTREDRIKPRKSKQEMEYYIQEFIKKCNDERPPSAIIFIGSHGNYPNQISTSDSKYLDLHRDIVDEFSHAKCPGLEGKPKMFFIQACQSYHTRNGTDSNIQESLQDEQEGASSERNEKDSSDYPLRRPGIEDVLICMAVMPGQQAQRDRYKGSWFPFCLTYMLMKHALKGKSLQTILTKVERMLESIQAKQAIVQVPVRKELKFKPLYFSQIPVGSHGDNNVKKYCKLPRGLREFPDGGKPKWTIISTVSSHTTCAKINDNLENARFLEWQEFTLLFNSRRGGSKNVVDVVTNCNIENLKRLNKVDLDRNVVLVICEVEKRVKALIDQLCPWTSKVELSVDDLAWEDLTLVHQDEVIKKLKDSFEVKLENGKLRGKLLADLITGEEIKLFKDTLPVQLSYYVQRSILTRTKISNNLFDRDSASSSSPHPDIFIVRGVDRYRLSSLVRNEVTGTSSEYLQGRSKAKFLSLDNESPSHLERVFSLGENVPVHLLNFEDGKLKWLKSKGDLEMMQKYISHNSQEEYREANFCSSLPSSSNSPICISDCPGMGKSVLLAKMGRRLSQLFPERLVFYIALREIMEHLRTLKLKNDTVDASALEKILMEAVCENTLGKAVLRKKLKLGSGVEIELLLDGLDEADSSDSALALTTLNLIKTSFKSVRLWVTTRPHLLWELENNLTVMGYNILPFREEDQVQFLTTFWHQGRTELDEGKTKQFAQHCLKSLNEKMNAVDHDVAGIPLLCLLIGEIYEKDVAEFAQPENSAGNPVIQLDIVSVTKLYEGMIGNRMSKYKSIFAQTKASEDCDSKPGLFTKLLHLLIRKKLDKYSESSKESEKLSEQKLKEMHASLALAEIFPAYFVLLHGLLSPVEMDEVLKVGIVTFACTTQSPSFIHRTFAEYFVAWFLVDRLTINETWSEELIYFLLEWVLGRQICHMGFLCHPYLVSHCPRQNVIDNEPSPVEYSFANPVLGYFLNFILDDSILQDIPALVANSLSSYTSSVKTMQQITSACICSDFVNIFKLFVEANAFAHFPVEIFHPTFLTMAIQKSSLELIKHMISNYEQHSPDKVSWQKEALEMAVFRGDFTIVEFLIKEKGFRSIVKELGVSGGANHLMHMLLLHSKTNPGVDIDQKLQVLRMLCKINPGLLEAKDPQTGETPLLLGVQNASWNANMELLTELVSLGADVLIPTKDNGTLLHLGKAGNHFSNSDYHRLLSSIPTDKLRILGKARDMDGDTPLMTLVRFMDPEPVTVDIFLMAGADFNVINNDGNSALAIAIENGRSKLTISHLLNCTADPSWKGKKGESILHVAAWYGHSEAIKVLLDEHKLNAQVTETDVEGLAPLDYVIKSDCSYGKRYEAGLVLFKRGGKYRENYPWLHVAVQTGNLESVKLLLRLGFIVNLQDESDGNTPLHLGFGKCEEYPAHYDNSLLIAKCLVNGGANTSILNELGETALHTALKNDNLSIKAFRFMLSKTDTSVISPTCATHALRLVLLEALHVQAEGEQLANNGDHPTKKPKLSPFNPNNDDKSDKSVELEVRTRPDKILAYLIEEKGADVNWKRQSSETLLHLAARGRNKDASLSLIKYLIDQGVEVTAGNEAFLHTYISNSPIPSPTNFHDLVEFILARDSSYSRLFHTAATGNGQTPLHLAMCYLEPMEETLKLLQSNKTSFNSIDKHGHSLLAYAIMGEQRKELLSFLIEHGADYKYINSGTKSSMLHIAVEVDNLDALKLLLDLGELNVNEVDGNGCTPLDIAIRNRNGKGKMIIEYLTKNGGGESLEGLGCSNQLELQCHEHEQKREQPSKPLFLLSILAWVEWNAKLYSSEQ